MTEQKHGLSIGIERTNDHFFLRLKATGTLTHEDYEKITPLIESAVGQLKWPVMDVLIDSTELEGWTPGAAWDDFKLSLKHGSEFNKIALYGNKRWQEMAAKVGSWFMTGDMQYFENEQAALAWLLE